MAKFSQLPTLADFIQHACRHYGFGRHRIRDREFGTIRYLRRGKHDSPGKVIVDLPAFSETSRLTRPVLEGLCRKAGIPLEDFGIEPQR